LKIALDATYSLGPNLSGVGVYSREILYGLAQAHPETRFLFCYRPHRFSASFRTPIPPNSRRRLLWRSAPSTAELFHALNQRIERRHRRTVVTFHDLFVMSGEYSTPEFRERFARQAKTAAERADLIVAVSRFTARQVEDYLHVDPARIRVILHGVRPVAPSGRPVAREQMILFVGAIQKRKNVVRLVRAFEQTDPGWKLVLAGSYGYGSLEALARIETSSRRDDIEVLGYVPDAVLEALYQRASVFAFPSLDEGFGMPVLDAMARGVPVLTSFSSAMPEVAGDAALAVDPLNTESVAEGLRRITRDVALRDELSLKGHARCRKFSWEKAVDQTWGVYQELLGKNS